MNFYVAISQHDKTAAYAACPVAEDTWRTHMQMIARNVKEWEAEGAQVNVVNGPTMRLMMARTMVKL